LSNKAFETVELLQVALTLTITPYWEDSAREGSAVSPGGRKQSMRYDINNPDRLKSLLTPFRQVLERANFLQIALFRVTELL